MSKDLKSKIRPLSPSAIGRMQRQADRVISALSGQFQAYATGTLAEIEALMASPLYEDGAWRARVNALAHNLKGLGGTFGYDLMTTVADSMCRAIAEMASNRDAALHRRLRASTEALGAILKLDLKGDGGTHGRNLLATLRLPVPGK